MIKEKIMNHTRSDTDRMRMLLQIFNDGGSQSHGIDMDEFYAGLVHRFGLNAPRSLTNKLFTKIDSDGSGHIDTKELCNHLFPQTADYTQKSWYVRSEEKAVQKLAKTAKTLRSDPLHTDNQITIEDECAEAEPMMSINGSSLRFSSPWQI